MKRYRNVEPLGPMLAKPILFSHGDDMPIRRRKKQPALLDELVTPVVPGSLLDDGVAAAQEFEAACKRGPVVASEESLKLLHDMLNIFVGMRDRIRTEPYEIPIADWATAKGLTVKKGYRLAEEDGAIPGLVRIGRLLFVRNPNLSADALLSRVHPT
jgi:hypothetical protein